MIYHILSINSRTVFKWVGETARQHHIGLTNTTSTSDPTDTIGSFLEVWEEAWLWNHENSVPLWQNESERGNGALGSGPTCHGTEEDLGYTIRYVYFASALQLSKVSPCPNVQRLIRTHDVIGVNFKGPPNRHGTTDGRPGAKS